MAQSLPDSATILSSGRYLAHRYNETNDCFRFIDLPLAQHRKLTFITDEHLPKNIPFGEVPASSIPVSELPTVPIHFIFHSAYCCSTMLARAFDIPGISMGLKEPVLLNDLVGWRRRKADPGRLVHIADLGLSLLSRPFTSESAIIIKPSNLVTPLAPGLMKLRPDAHALLLYAPIESYLQSITKKGLWGRRWVREALIHAAKDGFLVGGFSTEELLGLTDLQVAALGWLSQHQIFNTMVKEFGVERIKILDSDTLLANQHDVFVRLVEHFELHLDADIIAQVLAGPAFTTHSKSKTQFNANDRSQEQQAMQLAHGEEIDLVCQWCVAVAEQQGINLDISAKLFR